MTDEQSVGAIVVAWHGSSLTRADGSGRTARARLRRCASPVDALAVAETHELYERLKEHGKTPAPDRLALLAATFARLKCVRGDKLAALLGRRAAKDGPRRLSELRFQSLIRVRSHRDLMPPLRRSLAVLGSDPACNGWALAEDLYWWDDDARNRWCFQYFGAEFAAANEGETIQ